MVKLPALTLVGEVGSFKLCSGRNNEILTIVTSVVHHRNKNGKNTNKKEKADMHNKQEED